MVELTVQNYHEEKIMSEHEEQRFIPKTVFVLVLQRQYTNTVDGKAKNPNKYWLFLILKFNAHNHAIF